MMVLESSLRGFMSGPIRIFLPRIYVDTCILTSAFLESDPKWQTTHSAMYKRKKRLIEASREIIMGWEYRADRLKTSTFAIGEFIGTGSKFNKTLGEMLRIVDSEILTKCRLCKTPDLKYDKQIIPEKMRHELRLAEIVCEGVRDQKGELVGNEFILTLFLDMTLSRMASSSGSLASLDFRQVKLDKIRSYRAPWFEIMLFQKASELANKYDLGLGDALNLLYAKGEAEYLVTNDNNFVKRWKSNPYVQRETQIEVITSRDFLRMCKRRGYLKH